MIDARLPATVDAPRRARQRVAELDGLLSGEQADDVRLLVSELVTSALVHASDGTEVWLRIDVGAGRVRVEVYDSEPDDSHHGPAGPAAGYASGAALDLVDKLADRWEVVRTNHGRCVWFEFDRAE